LRLEPLEPRHLLAVNLQITDALLVDGWDNPISAPVVGEQVFIRATWQTTDLTAADKYIVRFSVDGVDLDSTEQVGEPGQRIAKAGKQSGWFAAPGAHSVNVMVDSKNTISEENETDNSLTFSFTPVEPTTLPSKFVWPLNGTSDAYVVNYVDVDPRAGQAADFRGGPFQYDGHAGVDSIVPGFRRMDEGVPVFAVAAGTVTYVTDGYFDRNCCGSSDQGNQVTLDHGNGWYTRNVHLARGTIPVRVGDHVSAGQLIGFVGSSGNSSGMHLHQAIRHNGAFVETNFDPDAYWASSRPYQADLSTSVVSYGITNYAPWDDIGERPSDITVFPPDYTGSVWFWYWLSNHVPGNDFRIRWYRPNGTISAEYQQTLTGTGRASWHAWYHTPNWSSYPGVWSVALLQDGVELVRTAFVISASTRFPEIRLSQESAYVLDERTTPIAFGQVAMGSPSPQKTFTVENQGFAPLLLADLDLPPGFSLAGDFPVNVAAGTSATFTLEMDTARPGKKFGEVRFLTNDPDESPFSFNVEGEVAGEPPAGSPVITLSSPALAYHLGQAPKGLDPEATLNDSNSTNFAAGSLTVEFASNGKAGDQLAVRNEGVGAGQIGVSGSSVTHGGSVIGTLVGGDSLTPLTVTFNANATLAAVQALMRNVTYSNLLPSSGTAPRYLRFTVVDDTGQTSNLPYKTVVPVYLPPTISDIADLTTDEDVTTPTVQFSMADVETPADGLSLTASSSDAGLVPVSNIVFAGNGTDRTIRITPAPNQVGATTITVTVTDANGGTASDTFVLTVTAANDVPVRTAGTLKSIKVAEDSGNTTAMTLALNGVTYGPGGGADEAGQTLTYTITAIPSYVLIFEADKTTPVLVNATLTAAELQGLTYKTVADASGTGNLTWSVTDNGTPAQTLTENLAITVTAVNDFPLRTAGTLTPISVAEDSADTTAVTLGLTGVTYGPGGGADETGQTLTYRLTAIPSYLQIFKADGMTAVPVSGTVTGAELQGLKYKTVLDANGTGNLTWSVTDNGTPAQTLMDNLAIAVTSVNDMPVRTGGTFAAINVVEDSASGTAVTLGLGALTYGPGGGPDEAGQTLTYAITTIPSCLLLFKADGVTQVPVNATVTAAELRGLKYKTVAEANGAGNLTWTVADNGTPAQPLTESLSVTVAAINDAPVRTAGTLPPVSVAEDSANATALALGLNGVTYGPGGAADESSQTLTYTLTAVPAHVQLFQADGTTPVLVNGVVTAAELQSLTYKTVADANGTGNLTWTVTDSGTPAQTLTENLAITVTAVNDVPARTAGTLTPIGVAEDGANTTAVTLGLSGVTYGSGGGADEAGQMLSYTITATPSYALIVKSDGTTPVLASATLTAAELQGLKYKTVADANGTGSLTWTVTDSGTPAQTLTENLAITVTAVNDVPVFTSTAAPSVPENTTSSVVTLAATDPDLPAQTVSFSITGGADEGEFQIVAGQLQFKAAPDYEAPTDAGGNNVYEVSVTADDGAGGTTVQNVSVTVTPVNDNSPVFTSSGAPSVAENTTAVVTLAATDADLPVQTVQTVTFSITGGVDQGQFEIVGGQLRFKTAPDYEAPADAGANNVYEVSVTADDGAGRTTVQNLSVTVTPVNDPPVLDLIGNQTVDEEAQLQFTVTGGDPNDIPPNTVTLSAMGLPTGATFTPTTGVFTWTPSEAQQGEYAVIFMATDDGSPNLADSETVAIAVREVNDAPVLDPIGTRSVDEEALLQFTVTAGDPNDILPNTVTLSATGLPTGATFDPATGVFAWTPAEGQQGQHVVTFTATDDGVPSLTDSEAVTIAVLGPTWQNPRHRCDVDDDGYVEPLDVLVLINDINAHDSRDLLAASPPTPLPAPFLDPSGDDRISPLDVLIVINYINTHGSGPIPLAFGGEGEYVSGRNVHAVSRFIDIGTTTDAWSVGTGDGRQEATAGIANAGQLASGLPGDRPVMVMHPAQERVSSRSPEAVSTTSRMFPRSVRAARLPEGSAEFPSETLELEDAIAAIAAAIDEAWGKPGTSLTASAGRR
jgi:murein DD-endopeptidase MepM/ murein hydrolase activator NlpD